MGLSQPKKKVKLSHDPNNTNWTNNTSSFGHRILTAHGWTPGEYLGARNAAHAESYTSANASHIRVVLKDDNLGLGAKSGSGQGAGECTGLDAYQSLLGRLNAADEAEFVREEKKREVLKKAIYTERKWGSMRFVKGGFLVGDRIVEIAEAEARRVRKLGFGLDPESVGVAEGGEGTKGSRKEKRSKKYADDAEMGSMKDKGNDQDAGLKRAEETEAERKLRRKERKRKSKEEGSTASPEKLDADAERALRKMEKRKKKEEKKKRQAEESISSASKKRKVEESIADVPDEELPRINSPRPPILRGRHAVRARYIAQKRLASMDSASLNQIFMVKG